jgi:hypothetical protein
VIGTTISHVEVHEEIVESGLSEVDRARNSKTKCAASVNLAGKTITIPT